jgi:dienelactone hydrolase
MRIELPSGTAAETAGEPGSRGLVVVPDIMGLRPLFDDLVERLAVDWNCRVVAPDLYSGQQNLDLQERFAAASALSDADVLRDMVEAADATSAANAAAIGFCMGGMYVLKAASTRRFNRLVSFYGMIRVPDDWRGEGQGEPLGHLEVGDPSSVLAVIGTADPYTPPGQVEMLTAAGVSIAAYEGAEHGFVHDPSRPAHRPADATDAWSRAGEWLWS